MTQTISRAAGAIAPDDYLQQTGRLAARFMRRHRAMILWQYKIRLEVLSMTGGHGISLPDHGRHLVLPRLPASIPAAKEEVAILRAYLAAEIDQILFGKA